MFDVPVTIAPTASGGLPTAAEVTAMISSTMVRKRKRAGTHVVVPQAPTAPATAVALTPAAEPKPSRPRAKMASAGPKGAPPQKTKRLVSRAGQPPPEASPSPVQSSPLATVVTDADKVFDAEPAR